MLLIASCSHDVRVKDRDVKLYKASSFDYAIVRKQDDEIVSCLDHKFDDFVCMSKDDLQYLLETYDGCNCK